MTGKRSIPHPNTDNQLRFNEAVKERLEDLSGVRGGKVKGLPAQASSAEIIEKINEIISRLQG